jgi:hypothetical protein
MVSGGVEIEGTKRQTREIALSLGASAAGGERNPILGLSGGDAILSLFPSFSRCFLLFSLVPQFSIPRSHMYYRM